MSPWQLRCAARALKAGGVVAYPTEAVWGLGCDPSNQYAVVQICALKHRATTKGLIVIAADFEQCRHWLAPLSKEEIKLIATPGDVPTTWLVPTASRAPRWLTGHHDTLAIRITRHPIAAALCRAAGMPLVSTSANPATRPPARTSLRVRHYFGDRIDYLVPGPTGGLQRPSRIRELRGERVVRHA